MYLVGPLDQARPFSVVMLICFCMYGATISSELLCPVGILSNMVLTYGSKVTANFYEKI